jgi:hypothetical protein
MCLLLCHCFYVCVIVYEYICAKLCQCKCCVCVIASTYVCNGICDCVSEGLCVIPFLPVCVYFYIPCVRVFLSLHLSMSVIDYVSIGLSVCNYNCVYTYIIVRVSIHVSVCV